MRSDGMIMSSEGDGVVVVVGRVSDRAIKLWSCSWFKFGLNFIPALEQIYLNFERFVFRLHTEKFNAEGIKQIHRIAICQLSPGVSEKVRMMMPVPVEAEFAPRWVEAASSYPLLWRASRRRRRRWSSPTSTPPSSSSPWTPPRSSCAGPPTTSCA